MRTVIFLFASLLSVLAHAADPRNTSEYHVIFDLEARGRSALVNGYGSYLQIYSRGGTHLFRYCENFEGHGTSGRPNPNRARYRLVPIGQVDTTAYRCRDFTPDEIALGQPLIRLGDRSFFALKSSSWTERAGGEVLLQFAKRLPLIGAPTFKTLRIRASRAASGFDYDVEAVVPKTGVLPFHFLLFGVSDSGIGLPNGISGLTLDPIERNERLIDLDVLEGPIQIRGGKSAPKGDWPSSESDD